jgi:hypothetical protein
MLRTVAHPTALLTHTPPAGVFLTWQQMSAVYSHSIPDTATPLTSSRFCAARNFALASAELGPSSAATSVALARSSAFVTNAICRFAAAHAASAAIALPVELATCIATGTQTALMASCVSARSSKIQPPWIKSIAPYS